jgi:hypothetical protein
VPEQVAPAALLGRVLAVLEPVVAEARRPVPVVLLLELPVQPDVQVDLAEVADWD